LYLISIRTNIRTKNPQFKIYSSTICQTIFQKIGSQIFIKENFNKTKEDFGPVTRPLYVRKKRLLKVLKNKVVSSKVKIYPQALSSGLRLEKVFLLLKADIT